MCRDYAFSSQPMLSFCEHFVNESNRNIVEVLDLPCSLASFLAMNPPLRQYENALRIYTVVEVDSWQEGRPKNIWHHRLQQGLRDINITNDNTISITTPVA